eukprot:163825_1
MSTKQKNTNNIESSTTSSTVSPDQPQKESVIDSNSTNTNLAAEYIYNSMLPPQQNNCDTEETVEALQSGMGKRRPRLNTAGSGLSGRSLLSMDLNFLCSEDVAADGGLSGLGLSGGDLDRLPMQSSDVVKDILLPDTSSTAATALKAEYQPIKLHDGKSPSTQQQSRDDKFCPIAKITTKLQRISTGESIAPLSENFRLSSKEWINDFQDDAAPGAMHQSLFMDSANTQSTTPSAPQQQPIKNYTPANPNVFEEEYRAPIEPLPHDQMLALSAAQSNSSPSSSLKSGGSKKKKKKRRELDETIAIDPTDDDVLFGRGGYTNSHPGNIRYRAKALELRPWYEASSKEEKYNISELLIESVKAEGGRFLEKGKDGMWHEVLYNGARKKASQQLRERLKGTRRNTHGGSMTSGIHSSVTSAGSNKRESLRNSTATITELIGDLMPTDVVGV